MDSQLRNISTSVLNAQLNFYCAQIERLSNRQAAVRAELIARGATHLKQ